MQSFIHPPNNFLTIIELKNQHEAVLKPYKDIDGELLYDFYYSCSSETIYYRFMSLSLYNNLRKESKQSAIKMIKKFTNPTHNDTIAIIAIIKENHKEKIVAEGMFVKTGKNRAEIAVMTSDNWQRQGLAINIGKLLKKIALSRGIKYFEGDYLLSNYKLKKLFQNLKIKYNYIINGDSLRFEIDLEDPFYE